MFDESSGLLLEGVSTLQLYYEDHLTDTIEIIVQRDYFKSTTMSPSPTESATPTVHPSGRPTPFPSNVPTGSVAPSSYPSTFPSESVSPTEVPSITPSMIPTSGPTLPSSFSTVIDFTKGIVRRGGGNTEYIYVLNTQSQSYGGHNNHRATNCGGYSASILSQEEDDIVDALIKQTYPNGKSIFIGGTYVGNGIGLIEWEDGSITTNDELGGEEEEYHWYDTWNDNLNPDEPNYPALATKRMIRTGSAGNWKFQKYNSQKKPGVLLLPMDFDDLNSYPNCIKTNLVTL